MQYHILVIALLGLAIGAAADCGNCNACGPLIPGIQFPQPQHAHSQLETLNSIASVDACCAACNNAVNWPGSANQGNITCNAWSYQQSTQTCNLIFGYPQTPANRDYYEGNEYVGVRNPTNPGTCTVVGSSQGPIGSFSLDFANFDLTSGPESTAQDCCQYCLSQPLCTVFSFTTTLNTVDATSGPLAPNPYCWTKTYGIVSPTWTSGFNANIGATSPCTDTTYVYPTVTSATANSNGNTVTLSYDCPGNLGCPGVNDPGY